MTSWLNPQFVPELLQEMETVTNAPNNDQMTQVTDRYLAKRPEIVNTKSNNPCNR